ncbi:MAG: AMP nucleosidase, partial [Maricaulis sp.]|nr:AMP nucleosidase [Maricaulis sp.]
MKSFKIAKNPAEAVDQLSELYEASVQNLRTALGQFLDGGKPPGADERAAGIFAYPELRVTYNPEGPPPPVSRAFGKFTDTGLYATTVTHPDFFRDYLLEQLDLLNADYEITIETGLSETEIPFSYVLDGAEDL